MKTQWRPRITAAHVFFAGLIVLAGLAAFASFVLAARWRQEPFAGFFTEPNLVVSSLGEQVSSATGLRNPDRIMAVNGTPIHTPADMRTILRTVERGQTASYTVQREDGQVIHVVLPVTQLSLETFFALFFLPYALGVFYLVVGAVIYSLRTDARPTQAFLIVCVTTALCLILLFNSITSHELVRLWVVALPLAGAALLHLTLVFPREWHLIRRAPALAWLPYAPALAVAIAAEWTLDDPLRYAWAWRASFLLIGVFALAWLLALVVGFVRARDSDDRRPVSIVAVGGILAFGPITVWMLLSAASATFPLGPEIPALSMAFFPLAVSYAVIRHGLFEIKVLVRRSLLYFTLTVMFLGLYFLFVTLLQRVFQSILGETTDLSVIISTLLIGALFMPLRNQLQTLIDRTFYRERYNYQRSLLRFAESTRTIIDLSELLRQLVAQVRETMHAAYGTVFLADDAETLTLAEAQGVDLATTTVSLSPALVTELLPGRPLDVSPEGPFAALQARLLVPLVHRPKGRRQHTLEGILGLGPKLSGAPYSSEDHGLLTTLADQVAAAITIAQLVRENEDKSRMEQELAIARDIQQAFFPQRLPTMPGLDIAALCRPARETGGDLYDFIPLGEHRLGVIIGDVSGKSIPAALIMAVSLGVLRVEIDDHERPSVVLHKANGWLCRDMPRGHFVSLLYAAIDPQAQQLTLGNAGHLWPIHLRGDTAEYVKPPAALPLGLVADVEYEESSYDMRPGDRLLLYTDGVVEAMNERLELFGFERLLETCQRTVQARDPQVLLDAVLAAVHQFAGDAEQADDLTLIALAARDPGAAP